MSSKLAVALWIAWLWTGLLGKWYACMFLVYGLFIKMCINSFFFFSITPLFENNVFHQKLLTWIISSNQSFNEVESQSLADMVTYLNKNARLPTRRQIRNELDVKFEAEEQRIKELIQVKFW
jgi:hypothetical protein